MCIRFFAIIISTAVSGCLSLAVHSRDDTSQTCQPQLPLAQLLGVDVDGGGFEVCLFNNTGNLVTSKISAVGNIIWSIQTSFLLGNCFCRQDCKPSQIVCRDPELFDLLIPSALELNILNGIAQFIYQAEMFQLFCFCPGLVPPGVDPCIIPVHPQVCVP